MTLDLKLLEAEFHDQLGRIQSIFDTIAKRGANYKRGPVFLESTGYQLHNLYCAIEDLFRIVATYFENNIETQSHWHANLLKTMRLKIKGVRPALLSSETYAYLNDLRGFRHVFRHAYTHELDPEKVGLLLTRVEKLNPLFDRDAREFLQAIGLSADE